MCREGERSLPLQFSPSLPFEFWSHTGFVLEENKARTAAINIKGFTRDICYPFQKLWNEYCLSDLNSLKDHSTVLFQD